MNEYSTDLSESLMTTETTYSAEVTSPSFSTILEVKY